MEPIEPRPPDPIPVMTWQEAVKRAKLREGPDPDQLSPEEQSIIEEILDSDTIQVRLKNYLFGLVLARVEGVLSFIPGKRLILGWLWDKLNLEFDDLIDKFKERRDRN